MPQLDQAEKYLKLLDPDASKFLFACYDYRKIERGKQIYATIRAASKKLEEFNDGVFCVYVTVNETDGPQRKKQNIKRCRAIWVEDDNKVEKPRSDWPIEPSLIVESSPGKFHYYWFTSTTKVDEWNAVMATMVNEYGCDNKAKDIARVLRLPGFMHKKNLDEPYLCKIVKDSNRRYKWFEIKSAFKPSEAKQKAKANPPQSTEYSEENAINELLTSKNYHGSLTSISMSLTNRGVSRELQYMTLFGLMNKIPAEKRRPEWEARISDEHLYECIDTAIRKKEEEDKDLKIEHTKLEDIAATGITLKPSEVIFPPGNIGELCQEILEMAPYPNREIALSGGIALVAGIIGRTYNIIGMGLNVYIAILADSGIGKANLKDSVNLALRVGGGKFNVGENFVGRSRFTGPKAIFEMLSNGMSRVCIIEEAGLVSESQAGDVAGVTRAFLDLYTSCGYGKWAGDEGYSNSKESIPALHSPALTIVSVSTPKSFLRGLKSKSADVSGEVARLWMMRNIGEKPYLNRNRRKDFSTKQISLLGKFITICLPFQEAESELRTVDVKIKDEFVADSDYWVDLENKYMKEGDHLRRTLCSRAWAKIIKLAAICSVYNGQTEVGKEEYDWAKDCIQKELSSITESFTHETSDDLGILAKNIVCPAIAKLLSGGYKTKLDPKLSEYGIFTYTSLNQNLKNNAILATIDDDTTRQNPKTGLDKVLAYIFRSGLIIALDEKAMKKYGSKSKIGYKITPDFYALYMD